MQCEGKISKVAERRTHLFSEWMENSNIQADCYADSFVKDFDEVTVCLTEMLKLSNVSIFFHCATTLFVPI